MARSHHSISGISTSPRAKLTRTRARDGRSFRNHFSPPFFRVAMTSQRGVADWVTYLRIEKLWGLNDPLFPATKIALDDNLRFAVAGLDRKHWSSASPIRQIFKEAFAAAGLPYFNPHSFRKTLALLGGRIC